MYVKVMIVLEQDAPSANIYDGMYAKEETDKKVM